MQGIASHCEPIIRQMVLILNHIMMVIVLDDISEERLKVLWGQRTPRPRPLKFGPHDQDIHLKGFSEEPFVQAAAKFHANNYRGIFRLLTDAIDKGHAVFVPHALLLRGILYSLWREDEKGLKDLRNLVTRQGVEKKMCVGALVRQARIFASQKKMEKCDICFQKALAIDSTAVDIFIHRGRILIDAAIDLSGLSSCIADLEKAVSLAPNSGHAAYLLATAYFRKACLAQSMQMFTKAGSQFEEARKKFPDFVDGLILNAMFLQCLNQLEKAEELLQTAIKLQPENALCHFTLGQVRISKSGDIADGRRHMEKAIALDSSCLPAYNVLVTYEMQCGNMARATELSLKAMQNTRSIEQLIQTVIPVEVIGAVTTACEEYGVTFMDLAARFFATLGPQLQSIMANSNNY